MSLLPPAEWSGGVESLTSIVSRTPNTKASSKRGCDAARSTRWRSHGRAGGQVPRLAEAPSSRRCGVDPFARASGQLHP